MAPEHPEEAEGYPFPRNLVGIYAPVRRSGKGTVGDVLVEDYGFTRVQFSAPIKFMWSALAGYAGLDELDVSRTLEGDLKEVPLSEVGLLSFRRFANDVGDYWGREHVDKAFWLGLWQRVASHVVRSGGRVVADDLRYPNEFDLIKRLGGVVLCVKRPLDNGGRESEWPSEGLLGKHPFDDVIMNDGTTEELRDLVPAVLARHQIYP